MEDIGGHESMQDISIAPSKLLYWTLRIHLTIQKKIHIVIRGNLPSSWQYPWSTETNWRCPYSFLLDVLRVRIPEHIEITHPCFHRLLSSGPHSIFTYTDRFFLSSVKHLYLCLRVFGSKVDWFCQAQPLPRIVTPASSFLPHQSSNQVSTTADILRTHPPWPFLRTFYIILPSHRDTTTNSSHYSHTIIQFLEQHDRTISRPKRSHRRDANLARLAPKSPQTKLVGETFTTEAWSERVKGQTYSIGYECCSVRVYSFSSYFSGINRGRIGWSEEREVDGWMMTDIWFGRALQAKQIELERQRVTDSLRKGLEKRPERDDLVERKSLDTISKPSQFTMIPMPFFLSLLRIHSPYLAFPYLCCLQLTFLTVSQAISSPHHTPHPPSNHNNVNSRNTCVQTA